VDFRASARRFVFAFVDSVLVLVLVAIVVLDAVGAFAQVSGERDQRFHWSDLVKC